MSAVEEFYQLAGVIHTDDGDCWVCDSEELK